MIFECDEERTRNLLITTRERIRSSRALNRNLLESLESSKKAILASFRVLQTNKAAADKLSYYAEACRSFQITPPQPE